jgi:hypothetical protein
VNLIHNKLGLAKVLTHKARRIQTFTRRTFFRRKI